MIRIAMSNFLVLNGKSLIWFEKSVVCHLLRLPISGLFAKVVTDEQTKRDAFLLGVSHGS